MIVFVLILLQKNKISSDSGTTLNTQQTKFIDVLQKSIFRRTQH